jgi:predicted nucleic acid-binding protein
MPTLTDATVLSNFSAIDRLDLLQAYMVTGYLTRTVFGEVQDGITRGFAFLDRLERHISPPHSAGWLKLVDFVNDTERSLYAQLLESLQPGEAASLAIAIHRGWSFLTDDKSVRETGIQRGVLISGTLGVLGNLVETNRLTVDLANDLLADMIRTARYRSPVRNLRDLGFGVQGETQ